MPYVTASAPVNDTLLARHAGDRRPDTTPASASHRAAAATGFTVHLRPLFDRAALAVIAHYRWRNISYIYDSNDGQLPSYFNVADLVLHSLSTVSCGRDQPGSIFPFHTS